MLQFQFRSTTNMRYKLIYNIHFYSFSYSFNPIQFQFVSQLEGLLKGVNDAAANVEHKLATQLKLKNQMLSKRQEQVAVQQQYFALINKIQENIRKNEILNQKMQEIEKK